MFASKILTKQRFIKFNFQKLVIMNKKLYIQPSFREVITQLDAYMDILSATADGETIEMGTGDVPEGGDAKLRGEWSENGLW